jgi:hypothetical protein
MKKATLLFACTLSMLACDRQVDAPATDPAPGATTGAPSGAAVGAPSRDWRTPAPAADAKLDGAIATFARACPEATACPDDVRRALFDAARQSLGRDTAGAVGALAAAASRGGADALAAGALAELVRAPGVLGEAPAEALEPASRRLVEVWTALSTSTAADEAAAISELTARVALAGGQAEPLLESSRAASSDEARAALYRWMLATGDEQVFEELARVWDSKKEPVSVRAGAARAALELDDLPEQWRGRLCEQARNQLEGGDPALARWWVATLWRCGGEHRARALDEANTRFELHTYDAEFARAFSQGPCASQASAGLAQGRRAECEAARGVLERALEDAEVAPEVKEDAARALARGWPDAGTRATLERAVKSPDEGVALAAKRALEAAFSRSP